MKTSSSLVHECQGELTLVFCDQCGIGRQELKNGDHGLAGLLTDASAVVFHKLEAKCQGIGILAGGGKRFGEPKLQISVVGIGGQGRACSLDPANLAGLETKHQLGLDLLGIGLEKSASFDLKNPCLCFLETALIERNAGQPGPCQGQLGVKREGGRIFFVAVAGSLCSTWLASDASVSAGVGKSRSIQVRITASG